MLQHAEDNGGDDSERVYTIQLRPKDPDPARNFGPGYGWAYALGRKAGNNHDRLSWNEQAAIVNHRPSLCLFPPWRLYLLLSVCLLWLCFMTDFPLMLVDR
jgi:hypothetical protein